MPPFPINRKMNRSKNMKNIENWNIETIQNITEQEAQGMALETLNIKGHNVYLVDFGGYFGYSRLVFADGRHIHYANDYELHHKGNEWYKGMAGEELRAWYIKTAEQKLFTEDEIVGPLKDYNDYRAKREYLHNYYAMRRPYISIFFIGSDAEREKLRKKTEKMYYDPVGFCYIDDEAFVAHHIELSDKLNNQRHMMENNYDYMVTAFKHEMYNHEYAINWQADYDTISAFANVNGIRYYTDISELFDAAGFSETQKKAYMEARRQYWKEQSEAV